MTEPTTKACPQCGAALPAGETPNLCAACTMAVALEGGDDETLVMEQGPSLALHAPETFPCEFGAYELLRLLGQGGMGTVYEAIHRATGRRVALKLLGQQLESPAMRQRFLREGRLAAGITHPNSLYVYGAEEIDGVPVISMEIMATGTLSDELRKRGPLPVVDAVDTVLGIIAGLEAAHAVGVLHRDIKPSNVFLKPDGTVAVGDYGLSVSTVATVDSFATATGVALGTPAYAAPEQLKGSELDVRADIYSVGATLYTLLTNRAPIEGNNPVQIVAAALDQKPEPVRSLRDEVPADLSQVVARCLAKRPDQRYANYGELRQALLQFSSETPEPAPFQKRLVAGLVDAFCGWLVPIWLVTAFYGRINTAEMIAFGELLPCVGLMLWHVLYTGLPEGLWGASLGKVSTGLRVCRRDGHGIGLLRGLGRAGIYWGFGQGQLVLLGMLTLGWLPEPRTYLAGGLMYEGAQALLLAVPFLSMRQRNGWAALWDLWTDSRVVDGYRAGVRPSLEIPPEDLPSDSEGDWIGPFEVLQRLSPEWYVAMDPSLRRRVWLCADQGQGVVRRELSRPGRARWLQCVVVNGESWDVYEAQPGVTLISLLRQSPAPHWDATRYWLYDLTLELAQAAQDGTLPPRLQLAHVWVTATGRAMLLDGPWPAAVGDDPITDVSEPAGRMTFLARVAECTDATTIPLHAHELLAGIASGGFEKLSFLAGNLRSAIGKRVRLHAPVRAGSMVLLPMILLMVALLGILAMGPATARAKSNALKTLYPDLPALKDVLRYRYFLPLEDRRFVRVHVAGHYRYEDFGRYEDWERYRLLNEHERSVLKSITEANLNFNDEELAAADQRLVDELPGYLEAERRWNVASSVERAMRFTFRSLGWLALFQLVLLVAFRTTVGQILFGFGLVDRQGLVPKRHQLVVRWLVAWGLLLVAVIFEEGLGVFSPILLALWAVGALVGMARPERGVPDELSGCWVVGR